MPRALWNPWGGGLFLMSEVPLYFLSDRIKPPGAEDCSRNRLKGILTLLCLQALMTSVLLSALVPLSVPGYR